MLHGYFNITVVEEWLTFFAALLLLDRKTGIWQLLKLLMAIILIAETTGWYLKTHGYQHEMAIPFNILMLLADTFLIWFFTQVKSLQKVKRKLLYLMYLFIVFALTNSFFFQGFWTYNSYSETFGDIMIASVCCYFFYTILTAEEHVDLLRLDYFWLATGLLFYSLGSAVLYQFSGTLKEYYDQSHLDIGTYINYALNLILYTGFIIAFFFRWKTTRL